MYLIMLSSVGKMWVKMLGDYLSKDSTPVCIKVLWIRFRISPGPRGNTQSAIDTLMK